MDNLDIKSIVDGRHVVKTEAVHLKEDLGFEIDLQGYKIHVSLKFDEGGSRYKGRSEGGSYHLECFNHNSTAGDTVFTPFPVAKLKGKSIFMTYICTLHNKEKNIRRFEYSIWMDV
ncbi:hypothetical protein D3C77_332340 [compost metagenome]